MRPAGIDRFAKSKGGVLHDDVKDGRVGTIDELETYLLELCGFEQGLMIQNIALAAEALGLGGFPHYGAHRFGVDARIRFPDDGPDVRAGAPQGLPRDAADEAHGQERRASRRPSASTTTASRSGSRGRRPTTRRWRRRFALSSTTSSRRAPAIFRNYGPSPWRDPAAIQSAIPRYSEENIQAVIAYCEYVHKHYGQFPAKYGPFRTLMAFQAHHLDTRLLRQVLPGGRLHRGSRPSTSRAGIPANRTRTQ